MLIFRENSPIFADEFYGKNLMKSTIFAVKTKWPASSIVKSAKATTKKWRVTNMNVKTQEEKGYWVVKLEGRLDISNSSQFEQECMQWIEQGQRRFILDLGGLEYISSAGLRSILAATKKLKAQNGSLSLCSLSGLVEEVVTVSGFDNILRVFPDVTQAMAEE
jgi:anti-anti-sigma factor